MHHRHEFVLHSLWNVEPMEVDMHKLLRQTTIELTRTLTRRAAAFKRRCIKNKEGKETVPTLSTAVYDALYINPYLFRPCP